MKVDIWSDVMCPFCYIGKKHFDEAMTQFDYADDIQVEWKSFQLEPDLKTQPDKTVSEHLAETKGWSDTQTAQMQQRITMMGANADLTFNFDEAIPANSFNAHRLAHFAKSKGKDGRIEEVLFKAYFVDGKNIDDSEVLIDLSAKIGLDKKETQNVLESDKFSREVKEDIRDSQKVGVQGVPFFVFNEKYAVSGAQPADKFLEVLQKSWKEWNKEQQPVPLNSDAEGPACGPGGNCD